MSYRKVGGLHFISVGRFGMSFYLRRKRKVTRTPAAMPPIYLNRLRDSDYETRMAHDRFFGR